MERVLVIFLSVALSCMGLQIGLPATQLSSLTSGGTPVLQQHIAADNAALEAALLVFEPVNASCHATADVARADCQSCVERKCNARGEDVCATWYTDVLFFVIDDVPEFFEETVPKAFIDLGDEIVDLGESTWDVVVDFNNLIDDAIGVDFGEVAIDIGEGFVDAGNFIVDEIYKPVEGVVVDIGNAIGDLFKGKKRQLRNKRQQDIPTTAPSCNNLKDDPNYWCLYYLDGARCSACVFDPDTQCPGWTAAVADVQKAVDDRVWITAATNQNYAVTSLTYDPTGYDADGKLSDCAVQVSMFGFDYSFVVAEAMNLFDAATSGAIIAEYAIAAAKVMH